MVTVTECVIAIVRLGRSDALDLPIHHFLAKIIQECSPWTASCHKKRALQSENAWCSILRRWGVKNLSSRRFLGLFCSFLVFGRPKNPTRAWVQGSKIYARVGFGPILLFFRLWKSQNPTRAWVQGSQIYVCVGLFFFRLWKTQKPTRAWVQGSKIYARVGFWAYSVLF